MSYQLAASSYQLSAISYQWCVASLEKYATVTSDS
jgi:hypothetical protein